MMWQSITVNKLTGAALLKYELKLLVHVHHPWATAGLATHFASTASLALTVKMISLKEEKETSKVKVFAISFWKIPALKLQKLEKDRQNLHCSWYV